MYLQIFELVKCPNVRYFLSILYSIWTKYRDLKIKSLLPV